MRPPLGSTRRTMQRAVVDLPQPLSPTSATVSPACTAKLTPLTACTVTPRLRKCFSRPLTSSSGSAGGCRLSLIGEARVVEVAEREMSGRLAHGQQRGPYVVARAEDELALRRVAAAARRVEDALVG